MGLSNTQPGYFKNTPDWNSSKSVNRSDNDDRSKSAGVRAFSKSWVGLCNMLVFSRN